MSTLDDCDALIRVFRSTVADSMSRTQLINETALQLKKEQEVNMEQYENHVNNLLYCLETIELVHANSTDILSELAILYILFELDLSSTQIAQCNSYLRLCLHEVQTNEIAVAASRVFAVVVNDNTSAEFVREEVTDAIEMLQLGNSQSEPQRLCGILMLIEVALKMPVMIMSKLSLIFDKLWSLLTIQEDETRLRVCKLFSLCTKLLGDRPSTIRETIYRSLSHELQNKLKSTNTECNIAGLIAFEPIMMYSVAFTSHREQEELICLLKPYTSIKTTQRGEELLHLLFRCLTVCCQQQRSMFVAHLLDATVRMALYCIHWNFSRTCALEMLSDVIVGVGAISFSQYVEETCVTVNDVIHTTPVPCWEALKCFATLCCVCKPAKMETFVDAFLWQIFSWGISAELIDCMRVIISSASAEYRTSLEETLLDMISITLCGMPFRQHNEGVERLARLQYKEQELVWTTTSSSWSTATAFETTAINSANSAAAVTTANNSSSSLSMSTSTNMDERFHSAKSDNIDANTSIQPSQFLENELHEQQQLHEKNLTPVSTASPTWQGERKGVENVSRVFRIASKSDQELAVALSALMQFGFSDLELMGDFLRDSVLPFIDHASDMVRHAAVSTIVKLLLPPCDKTELSVSRRLCVNTIIARMLVVAVTHGNAQVRETLLASFDEPFYPFLSEPQFLSRLYFALGDESVNCRVCALEQLCRMVKYDPSHILPSIREQMVLALQWVSCNVSAGSVESNITLVHDGLLLLNAIASTAPFFVVNFTESVLQVLHPMFASLSVTMSNLVPFLQCATSIAEAIRQFDFTGTDLFDELCAISALLWTLPLDRAFQISRLCCLRFMNAVLQPLMHDKLIYKLMPDLYRRLAALIQRGEESMAIRLEAVRCFGVIGALDAYIFQGLNVNKPDENMAMIDRKAIMMHRITQRKCAQVVLNAIGKLLYSCHKNWVWNNSINNINNNNGGECSAVNHINSMHANANRMVGGGASNNTASNVMIAANSTVSQMNPFSTFGTNTAVSGSNNNNMISSSYANTNNSYNTKLFGNANTILANNVVLNNNSDGNFINNINTTNNNGIVSNRADYMIGNNNNNNNSAHGNCILPEAVLRAALQTILIIAERCSCARNELHSVIRPLGYAICGLQDSRLFVSSLLLFANLVKMIRPTEVAEVETLYEVFCRVWEQLPRYRFLVIRLLSTVTEMSVGVMKQQSCSHHVHLFPLIFEAIVDNDNGSSELQLAVINFVILHVDTLQGCSEMVINSLLTLVKRVNTAMEVKVAAFIALRVLCSRLYVDELVGSIVRRLLALLPLLARTSKRDIAFTDQSRISNYINLSTERLLNNVVNIFIILLLRLQADFLKFSKDVLHAIKQYNCSYMNEFTYLLMSVARNEKIVRAEPCVVRDQGEVREVCKLCEHKTIETAMRLGEAWGVIMWNERNDENDLGEERVQHINQERIITILKTLPSSREEWIKWNSQFANILLEESPFQVLRCVALPMGINATPLIEKVPSIAHDIEYVAFRTVWNYAGATLRSAMFDFCKRAFEQALNTSYMPDEVLTSLLSTVEYMEHVGDSLGLPGHDISDCAWNRGMLAKALFWREAAYRVHPVETVESLITLYSQLNLVDSAVGLLNLADAKQRKSLMQSSLIKLSRYTEALELTRQELANDAVNMNNEPHHLVMHESNRDTLFTEKALEIKSSINNSNSNNKNNNNTTVDCESDGTTSAIILISNSNCNSVKSNVNFHNSSIYTPTFDSYHTIGHHRSYSEVNSALVRTSAESSWERYWSNHVRLMMCYSELGDFDAVLDEWRTIFDNFYNKSSLGSKKTLEETMAGSNSALVTSNVPTDVNPSITAESKDENNILSFVAPYAADASIRLHEYHTLESVLAWMPENVVHFHLSNAVLQIAHGNYTEAHRAITSGRTLLIDDLSSLLNESYSRAYKLLIVAQQLTELEEVIVAKTTQARFQTSDHIALVERRWEERIRTMTPTVWTWKQVLPTRALLIPPSENVRTRIRFLNLCRQEHARQMEKFTLNELLGTSDPSYDELTSKSANPRVVLQYIKYLSAANMLGASSIYGREENLLHTLINVHDRPENADVNARIYARLANMVEFHESINYLALATQLDPLWHRAWRSWAEVNVKLLAEHFSNEACTNAMEGYIHSIQLDVSDSTVIQDVLRLLTLWSKYCDNEQGLRSLRRRVFGVPARVWKLVVPQLIARLDTGSDDSCRLVADILSLVALDYPHTLIYPLNLCTMSDSERRKRCAEDIMAKLQTKYNALVSKTREMIYELLRISALVYERWYEKLESAATAFFGRQSVHDMLNILLPMYETFDAIPETVVEAEFNFQYKAMLLMAREWLYSYNRTHNVADVHSAWNLFHFVYKSIDEKLKASNILQLQFCSPILFEARNLSIGLPDIRSAHEEVVSMISSFHNELHIIASKQRPKRIAIVTNEGILQKYLLKGREDLRLDERVMQLFGLVNILMSSDTRSNKNAGFHIQRYSVTPLNDTAGLIGWVDGCDTLHELVKFYRERRDIPVELEMRMLGQIITLDSVKSYDYLTIMSKVEVMEFLADRTSGYDIRKAMWSSAATCEAWMDQRLMYTTSLANMSMVGYILGLGDRHPNNIMLQRSTGLVVHIDFGDCFEVAMTREKFPEKIPFRLTRMLRNALDVSSINGTFRANAETAMSVLRENRESVLALLEAFLQDPLISWRLVNRPGQEPELSNDHKAIEEQIKLANLREQNLTQQQVHSIVASITGNRREMESQSVVKHLFGEEVDVVHQGVLILKRLSSKLEGVDFITPTGVINLNAEAQVHRLIEEATDTSNIAQSWSGWYPFW